MELGRLKRWLGSPRAPAWAVAAAVLVSLPTLRLGLYLDDRWHRASLLHDQRWLPRLLDPLRLFSFADGSAAEHRAVMESGLVPWWTSERLRIDFFRPLSSLTHVIDYALWPRTPALMHLQSVIWYAALVALAAALYRRVLGRSSGVASWAIGLAALIYATDVSHGLPVAWLANRNALCAATFAFGALLAYDRGRTLLAALLFALGLGCGESAVGIAPFFVAHAVFLDTRPKVARVRALAPPLFVFLVYAGAYRAAGLGVTGSGVYTNPLRAPLEFAGRAASNLPLLLGCELGAPTPDIYVLAPLPLRIALLAAALLVVGLAGYGLFRLRASRTARFFAFGGTLAALPGCATFPAGRLMIIAGFGLVGLLAAIADDAVRRSARLLRGYVAWACGARLILSPLLILATEHQQVVMASVVDRLAEGLPRDPAIDDKRLVAITAPHPSFAYYVLVHRIERGEPVPRTLRTIASSEHDVRVLRESDRALLVHADSGFYRTGTDLLFRSLSEPMPAGTKLTLPDVTITITHAMPDGVPDEARFELAAPLESERWLLVHYDGETLAPFPPPKIGESRTLPARTASIF